MYSNNPPGTPLPPGLMSVLDNSLQGFDQNAFLDGSRPYYKTTKNPITKVAPAPPPQYMNGDNTAIMEAFDDDGELKSKIFDTIKPVFATLRILGMLPLSRQGPVFDVTVKWIIYSVLVLSGVAGFLGYLKYFKINVTESGEGRFEEAVIDYLFTIYLVPIVMNVIALYEARKQANVLTQMIAFERIYSRKFKRRLPIDLGSKPMVIMLVLIILGSGIMVTTHFTMANFVIYLVLPYCYINVITYVIGGAWYIYCDLIGNIATSVSEEFQYALRNIEQTSKVADYRSLWMMLSKMIRNVGNSFGYQMTFLCLYLFFVITLTVYGLLSQIQDGMGVKDIGLTITGVSAVVMLYFICDEAHFASSCVKNQFQKKILLIELTYMSEDAQQEINMFLRATEMNPTEMCLCGFFDVNRNLFKSLLATMVTYLVVLLQFQISIPAGENEMFISNSTMNATHPTPMTKN
ncbi:hypothetical protein ABEB36_011683 [Hypothenemus hampei]|uniref:Gustatory receptor n=1 Tax=Hypothenemus hampei TaxID=57062 RepID=A0ABD1E8U4_HYPHA